HRGGRHRGRLPAPVEPQHDVGGGAPTARHDVKTEELEMSRLQIIKQTTTGEILLAYPSAKIGLFQRYHVGGCSACGYESTDTLADVRRTHNLQDDLPRLVACIEESERVEARLHVSPADVRAALAGGEKVHLLDATPAGDCD